LWHSLTRANVCPGGRLGQVRQLLTTRNSLFPNDRLSELVCRHLTVARFEQLKRPFGTLATDLQTLHGALFTAGELRPALLASAAYFHEDRPMIHSMQRVSV
jgi:NTE family protein